MVGQQTISPTHLNDTVDSEHQHLSAADIVEMLHGLSAEQQNEFYQAIGLEHEEQFYSMLGLCPSTNDSLHSHTVRVYYRDGIILITRMMLIAAVV